MQPVNYRSSTIRGDTLPPSFAQFPCSTNQIFGEPNGYGTTPSSYIDDYLATLFSTTPRAIPTSCTLSNYRMLDSLPSCRYNAVENVQSLHSYSQHSYNGFGSITQQFPVFQSNWLHSFVDFDVDSRADVLQQSYDEHVDQTPRETIDSKSSNRKRKREDEMPENCFKKTKLENVDEQEMLSNILRQSSTTTVGAKTVFVCCVCNKQYTRKSNLRTHARTHIGCRPYSCSFCDKTFTRRSNWKSHEARHTGEKAYSCSYCEMRFVDWSTWKRHELTHGKVKPHSCDVCGKCFLQRLNMIRHQNLCTVAQNFERS